EANGLEGQPVSLKLALDSFQLTEIHLDQNSNSPVAATIEAVSNDTRKLTTNQALALNQIYMLTTEVSIHRREQGGDWTPTSAREKVIRFFRTTSNLIIDDHLVDFTYPGRDQRFLLAGEQDGAWGQIGFTRDLTDLLPVDKEYGVAFEAVGGDYQREVPLEGFPQSAAGRTIRYPMPDDLEPSTTYRVSLLARAEAAIVQNNAPTNNDANQPVLVTANLNLQPIIGLPLQVYDYEFSTSQYNLVEDKVAQTVLEFESSSLGKGSLKLTNPEGFDDYDLKGYFTKSNVRAIPPLFALADHYDSEAHVAVSDALKKPYQLLTSSTPSLDKFSIAINVTEKSKKSFFAEGHFERDRKPSITYKCDGKSQSMHVTSPTYPGHGWFDLQVENGNGSNGLGITLPTFSPVPCQISAGEISIEGNSAKLDYDVLLQARKRFDQIRSWYYQLLNLRKVDKTKDSATIDSGYFYHDYFRKYGSLTSQLNSHFLDNDASLLGKDSKEFSLKINFQNPGDTTGRAFDLRYRYNNEKQ
ncbi:MAG: hypothetical protein KTR24_08575, partial [Saprospiraceae bacterium]|nr:hypothetical protein [Saprospiraceae bacterium]